MAADLSARAEVWPAMWSAAYLARHFIFASFQARDGFIRKKFGSVSKEVVRALQNCFCIAQRSAASRISFCARELLTFV